MNNSSNRFGRLLNAAAIVLVLIGIVAFFTTIDRYGINYMLPPSPPERDAQETASSGSAMAGVVRDNIALSGKNEIIALDKAQFDTLIASSSERPVFFMIYASWCPHCKRMFHELNTLQAEYDGKIHVVTISIDNKEELAKRFADSVSPLRLDTYIMKDGESYRAIGDALRNYGLRFQGGISKSVGVPYNAVFYQGEPVAEIAGALPAENLQQLIKDISENAGQS